MVIRALNCQFKKICKFMFGLVVLKSYQLSWNLIVNQLVKYWHLSALVSVNSYNSEQIEIDR